MYAVKRLKSGKSDANMNLKSDNFIFACHDLYVHLSLLLQMMFSQLRAPHEMLLSIIVPIPKNQRKSMNDSANYRSIAISSIVGKILDNIVLLKHGDALQTTELQFGFKPNHSTTQCTFVLNEVIEYYRNGNTPVYVALLDASRAFDRVDFVKLFSLLCKRNMCPATAKFLLSMYIGQSMIVKWGQKQSTSFSCSNGVKQGGVLSPILFCVYMDELIVRLQREKWGCYVGHKFTGIMTYADDATLMAPSYSALMAMLKVCEEYAREFNVQLNSSKSQLILFNERRSVRARERPVVRLLGESIPYSDHGLHLGTYIGKGANALNMQKASRDLVVRCATIAGNYGHCSTDVLRQLFKTHCTSFYGAPLWALSVNALQGVIVAWKKGIKRIFGLNMRTRSKFIPLLLGTPDLNHQLMSRFARFWLKCDSSSNEIIRICSKLSLNSSSTVGRNRKMIIELLDMHDPTVFHTAPDLIFNHWNMSIVETDIITSKIITELLDCKRNHSSCVLNRLEIDLMLHSLSTQ